MSKKLDVCSVTEGGRTFYMDRHNFGLFKSGKNYEYLSTPEEVDLPSDDKKPDSKGKITKYNKLFTNKDGESIILDVYDVLEGFDVRCPALQHLTKKSLNIGTRGHKDILTDLDDIIASALRAKELEIQRQRLREQNAT